MNMREAAQFCRRTDGTYRAHFETREAAEKFAADPTNVAYHGDMAHLCLKCGAWHLSKPEWLVPDWARAMKTWN